jgi:hypothetical protein
MISLVYLQEKPLRWYRFDVSRAGLATHSTLWFSMLTTMLCLLQQRASCREAVKPALRFVAAFDYVLAKTRIVGRPTGPVQIKIPLASSAGQRPRRPTRSHVLMQEA